jgi:hypothetical protein
MKMIHKFKKYSFLLVSAIVTSLVMLSSCEEEPPFIDLTDPDKVLRDTTYISTTIPAAQDKVVLIEDISGVNCVNCPDAAVKAEDIKALHGERVVITTLLPTKEILKEFTDPKNIFTDFTNVKVDQLLNAIGPPSGLPSGMVDRKDFGNGKTLAIVTWDGHVNSQLQQSSSVNIELENEFIADKNELIITTRVTYTENQTDSFQNISIMLLESNMIGVQKDRNGINQNYNFKHVLRDFITRPLGDPITVSLVKGRVVERQYKIAIDPTWNIDNCDIVACVTSGKAQVVYQAAHKKAKS